MSAFLGVESSATGRRWLGPTAEAERQAEAIAQATALPLPLARVLAARGVAPEEAVRFLDPQLRELLPDPRSLKDMGLAAARFVTALKGRERIAVFADYDVDGGASAALLVWWLRHFGREATLYIPDRIDEGYGPNEPAMARLAAVHDLIVCVDCGTLSHGPVAAAKGADVIILDHHLGAETLPPALAVVNPNRQDESGELGHLCAASVVFLMLVEANRLLREEALAGPDLMALLDLVALADIARMDRAPTAYHLGFLLGPRVNAGGRIGAADLGARLLATADPHEAEALAERLEELNTERRDIENRVRDAALAQAETRGFDAPLVWAAGKGWHPGVVGIVAARLKEATNRPAVVIGLDGGIGKGSGRSVEGVDLGAAIQRLAAEGLLLKGGGHRMAAGLTVDEGRIEAAMDRLSLLLARQGAGTAGPRDLRLDGLMMPGAVTPALIEEIERAGPFGQGAPAPRFAFAAMGVTHARRIGENHLRIGFSDGMAAPVEAVAFGAFDGPIGPLLEQHGGLRFHLAGRLELNHWQGRAKPQLRLEDAARA
jgi:single-stranded-DNA-specific exonuclease